MLAQAGSLPLPAETPVLGEQHGDPGEISGARKECVSRN